MTRRRMLSCARRSLKPAKRRSLSMRLTNDMRSLTLCALTALWSNGRCSGCADLLLQDRAAARLRRAAPASSRFSDPSSREARMKLPERINSDAELDDVIASPSEADLECVSRL